MRSKSVRSLLSRTAARSRTLIQVAVPLLLIALAIVFQFDGLEESHDQYLERTRLNAQDLGATLAASIAGSFENIDLTLLAATDHIRQWQSLEAIDKHAFNATLFELQRRVPSLLALRVTNASGDDLFHTDGENFIKINVADRSYFRQLKEHPEAGMAISEPIIGRIEKKWVLICARRFNLPNGELGGIVYGSIDLEGLEEKLAGKEMKLADQDTFMLQDKQLNVITQYVRGKQDMQFVGMRFASPKLMELIGAEKNSGFYVANSIADNVKRIFYFQRIAGQPLSLVVGLSFDDALSAWRRELKKALIGTTVFAIVIALGAYLIYRAQNHQLEAIRNLEETRKALEQSNDELAKLSTTDGLTGLPNRRRFDEIGQHEWQRALRKKESLAIAMVDIDHFKTYNDHYGHQAGDQCLRKVAQTLATGLRGGGDFVARYGGEEFVIILPGPDAQRAHHVIDRLRSDVEALALPHVGNEPSLVVTFSAGFKVVVPDQGSTLAALIEEADKNLYHAKDSGRNQVFGT